MCVASHVYAIRIDFTFVLLPYYFSFLPTEDSPPLKKPKVEPMASPAKNSHSELQQQQSVSHSTPSSTSTPCHSSHPLPNNNTASEPTTAIANSVGGSSGASLPPPPSLTPSSSLPHKPQVTPAPSHHHPTPHHGSISNHLTQQVPPNDISTSATATAASSSLSNKNIISNRGSAVSNHHQAAAVAHYGMGHVPNSTGFVSGGMGQQPVQTDGHQQPQHNNNDVSLCSYI